MSRLTFFFMIIVSLANTGRTQDQTAKEKANLLVSQLVSPNRAPRIPTATAKYPEGYDKKAQEKVFRAYSELCDMGTVAFPHLFEHFHDQRYALTADGGASDVNFTVGQLCFAVVDLQLQPYKTLTFGDGDARERPRRPHYASIHKLRDLQSARDWWTKHQNMSLRDMQLEVLEWIRSEEDRDKDTFHDLERGFIEGVIYTLDNSACALSNGSPWAK